MKRAYMSRKASRTSQEEWSDVLICDCCHATERHVEFGEREDFCVKCAKDYPICSTCGIATDARDMANPLLCGNCAADAEREAELMHAEVAS